LLHSIPAFRSFQCDPIHIYILAWPDEATKTAGWDAFMHDEEWAQIKRTTSAEHGVLVGGIEDRTLHATAYSPRFGATA
jgi:hypothetical protein